MKVESAESPVGTVEHTLVLVPVGAGERAEFSSQVALVQGGEVSMTAATEDIEEVVEIERAYGRDLQLEQGNLARIHVYGMNRGGRRQGVVERVAAGARDDHHVVRGRQCERLVINCRIFPAGVVDESASVESVEEPVVEIVDVALDVQSVPSRRCQAS